MDRLVPFLLALPLAIAQADQNIPSSAPTEPRVDVYYGKPFLRDSSLMITDLALTIYPEDKLHYFPDPKFGLGSKITVTRATPVWIDDGGNRFLVRTFQPTAGSLLSEQGIEVGVKDILDPEAAAVLSWEGTITITRVQETEVVEKKSLAFETVTRDDSNLLKGTTRVEQEGKRGEKELTYKVRRENGREVGRELLSEKVVLEPVKKIVLNGTKVRSAYGPWAEMINEIAPKHGADPAGLAKIMYCESGGNALSYSAAGPYHGLFQFGMGTFTRLGYSADQINDPRAQIEAASRLYIGRYNHWPVCSRGT